MPERTERALVWTLFATFAAGFAWSVSVPDTARDIFVAYGIRHGVRYPVEGPVLGSAIHLGPLWFYVTALPLWISQSWLAIALFQGMICALKFPLAYHCGRRLHSRGFGLAWAAALALPGWSSLQQLIAFNAGPAETACLLILAAYLRCIDPTGPPSRLFLLGLALGFAAHIHPTTAPFAILALHVMYRRYRGGASVASAAAALACGVVLLFVPYVISQQGAGWPDWLAASDYAAPRVGIAATARATADLLFSQFHSGPRFAAMSLAEWQPWQAGLVEGVWLLLVGAALAGAIFRFDRREATMLAFFAATLVLLCTWVAVLRTTTPFYFMYVVALPAAGVVALGAVAIGHRLAMPRATHAFAALCIGLSAMVTFGMAMKTERGDADISAQVLDVKDRNNDTPSSDVWFPALERSALGRVLCAARPPLSLHGALAYVEDRSVGLDALLACGRAEDISLGGGGAGTHLLAVTAPAWKAMGASAACRIGPLRVVVSDGPFWPAGTGQRIADGNRYFPRDVAKDPAAERTIRFPVPGPGTIVVTNMLFGYERVGVVSASVEGREAATVFKDAISWVYTQGDSQPGPVEWQFRIAATSTSAIDIVFIPARGAKEVAGCAGPR